MTKLTYDHKGEWLLELAADGSAFARRQGGPIFHMGAIWNVEPPTVSGWRARIPTPRRAALVAGFEEARAVGGVFNLIPDEHASYLTLGDASITVVHRALEGNLALDRVVAELGGIAGTLFAGPPTDRLANPERDRWTERFPFSFDRPKGPEAPEVQPGALEHAQAAIDRFYAEGLEPLLARVAARSRPTHAPATTGSLENAEHTFTCKVTGGPAGKISLRVSPDGLDGSLDLTGFSSTSDVTIAVKPNELRRVHRQLVDGDARAFYDLDLAIAPFFCPQCNRSYSASHWKIYETSPTRSEGMCPSGHRRRMAAR
jgi:hypothetical protein